MNLEPSQIQSVAAVGLMASVLVETFLVALILKRRRRVAPVTEDEKAAAAAKREKESQKRIYRAAAKEARELARKIPHHLAQQMRMQATADQVVQIGEKKKKRLKWVNFEAAMITLTEIWFKVDGRPGHMPHGVNFYDLMGPKAQDKVIFNLEHGINRPCRWHRDSRYNVFLRVNLRNAEMGIPKTVAWWDAHRKLPASRRLAVAMGINQYSKLVYEDIRTWPHLLVAGATQQGKSTWLVQAITTLIKRNTPDQLRFIFVDLKDGLELSRFEAIPHCLQFVTEPKDVPTALRDLHDEYKKRVARYREKGVKNIRGYNSIQGVKAHPYIIMVIDELADVMLEDTRTKEEAVNVSVKLARKARAAGIHLWYCTQIIEAAILPLQIRGNFPGRLAFSMTGYTESQLVIGNGLAAGMGLPGRCVYQQGANQVILQAPIADDKEIQEAIEAAGKEVEVAPALTTTDIWLAALGNFGGVCRYLELYEELEGKLPQHKIVKALKDNEYDTSTRHPILDVNGDRYVLAPGIVGRHGRPRKLVNVNGSPPPERLELLLNQAWPEDPPYPEVEETKLINPGNGIKGTPADLLDIPEGDDNP